MPKLNSMLKYYPALVLALFSLSPLAQSEELSLSKAVQAAWSHHPSGRQAAASIRAKEAGVMGARAAYYPTASFTGALREDSAIPDMQANTLLSGQWTVWDSGLTGFRVSAAEAQLVASQRMARTMAESQALQIVAGWLDITEKAANSEVYRSQSNQAQRWADTTIAKKHLGLVSGVDVQLALANAHHAKVQLALAEARQKAAELDLSAQTGLTVAAANLASLAEEEARHLEDELNSDTSDNGKVRQVEAQERVAATNLRVAETGYRPSLTIQATQQWQERAGLSDSSRFAGATLSIPLFTGGSHDAKVKEARAQLDLASELLAETKLTQSTELQNAKTLRLALDSVVTAATEAKAAAGLAQELARGRYETGVGNFQELLQAQSQLTQSALAVVQARAQRLAQQMLIYQLAGELISRLAEFPNTYGKD